MGYMGLYAQGKRETGANPVRTRHCDQGVTARSTSHEKSADADADAVYVGNAAQAAFQMPLMQLHWEGEACYDDL